MGKGQLLRGSGCLFIAKHLQVLQASAIAFRKTSKNMKKVIAQCFQIFERKKWVYFKAKITVKFEDPKSKKVIVSQPITA